MFEFSSRWFPRARTTRHVPANPPVIFTRLSSEALEERWLLASQLDVAPYDQTPPIPDPFAHHAVTIQDLRARAVEHRYVPGDLIVALELPGDVASAQQTVAEMDWSDWLGVPDTQFVRRLLTTPRDLPLMRTSVSIVHLQIEAPQDVFTVIEMLADRPEVMWSSPNFIGDASDPREFVPNDTFYHLQYHHPLMQTEQAWDLTLGNPAVVIGVTDDGFALEHEDLRDNVRFNPGEIGGDGLDNDGNGYTDDVSGWDFIHNDNDPRPTGPFNDHGTHVAGIAAGRTNNSTGIAGTAGASTFLPLKFYDDYWNALIIAETYVYAADSGVQIVNTSYNVDQWVSDIVYVAAEQYLYDQGVLHLVSAGNNDEPNPVRQLFEQTLLVVSTEQDDSRSTFSNYGTGMDISAPGGYILSTLLDDTYNYYSGTSMASPNAAGVAALIWARNPTWTREQVAAQLLATADNIDGLNSGYAGLLGTGRVNAWRALTESLPAPRLSYTDVPQGAVGTSTEVARFYLGFDQVMDPSSARNLGNYELRSTGPDAQFDTADDHLYNLTMVSPYMVGTNRLRLEISSGPLGIGQYRFRAISGGLRNAFGVALDTNGDGVPGDSYEQHFEVTINPFVEVKPIGSQAAISWNNPGNLLSESTVDAYPVFLEAGHAIAISVFPQNAQAILSVEIPGLSLPVTSAGPGEPAYLPLTQVSGSGMFQVRVQANTGTPYSFDMFRNIDPVGLYEPSGAVSLENSLLNVGSGRFAAIGRASGSDGQLNFDWYNSVSKFVDISETGVPLDLIDDGVINFWSEIGNALFPAGWVSISNNGGIVSGLNEFLAPGNTGLPEGVWDRALLPFWDDLDGISGNVYLDIRVVNGINTLIVQWDERPYYPSIGDATFQLQLFETGPLAVRFAYPDVYFGRSAVDYGRSATVGIQQSVFNATEFSYNSPSLENGDVIDVFYGVVYDDVDDYQLDMTGHIGESLDVIVNGLGSIDFNTQSVQLLDPQGQVVATAVSNRFQYDLSILDYVIPTDGVYTIRVTANDYGNYALMVTRDLVFDSEPNDHWTAELRTLSGVAAAQGYLSGGSTTPLKYHDPQKFVDISATGNILVLGDDDERTIFTSIGNSMFPAGAVTVGNNGGILAGANRDLSYINQPLPVSTFTAALLPFWDDIDSDTGLVYWQETVVEGVPTLIVQWDNRPHYNNFGNATFQLQLFGSGSIAARFAYRDVIFGSPYYDNGIEATIGCQGIDGSVAQFSHHAPSVFDGDVIDFIFTSLDLYRLTLTAGEAVTFWTQTPLDDPRYAIPNRLDPRLSILDPNGNELALDSDGLDGRNSRLTWVPPVSGTYLLAVGNDAGDGHYTVHRASSSTRLEAGKLTNVTTAWKPVAFGQVFDDPVVLVSLTSNNDPAPTTVRIRNVTSMGFDVQLREWNYQDGAHVGESVSYMVVERGVTILNNGKMLVAGSATIDGNFSPHAWGFSFAATPAILTTLVSQSSEDPAVVRLTNVTPSGFSARLQEEEAADGTHAPETIHYLATLPGVGSSNGLTYEVALISGVTHKGFPTRFQQTYLAAPGLLAALQSYQNADTASVRLRELNAKRVALVIEEEQSADMERAHPAETVGVFAFRYVAPAGLTELTESSSSSARFGVERGTPSGVFESTSRRRPAPEKNGILPRPTSAEAGTASSRHDQPSVHAPVRPGTWSEHSAREPIPVNDKAAAEFPVDAFDNALGVSVIMVGIQANPKWFW